MVDNQDEVKSEDSIDGKPVEEVYTLKDGSVVKKFCLDTMSTQIANTECILDLLDVATRLAKLNVSRDPQGAITDVSLDFPKIDENLVQLALKNFYIFNGLEEVQHLSNKETFEKRRVQLMNLMNVKSENN